MGKGSILEGISLEIGGLIRQDTEGDIEHIRKGTTTKPDGGIDYERVIKGNIRYKDYIDNLKNEVKKNEE